MLSFIRQFLKILPTFLLAFVLALAVWAIAVTASDPTQERIYPRPVVVEIIGQSPGLMLTNDVHDQITLTLSAPQSIWDRLVNDNIPVRAIVDLSGMGSGTHDLPIQIQVGISPVRVISYTPQTLSLNLERLASKAFPIHLVIRNDPAIGFQAGTAQLSQSTVTVSGPDSLVSRVKDVTATLDINQSQANINRTVAVQALDANEVPVNGITITPDQVIVTDQITQRGGYRNVVVKAVLVGQIASGYRLTNITVSPPAVTVFSTDPSLVEKLPGYIETTPINLNGSQDGLDLSLGLNLPNGVQVVGDQSVQVQIGVAAIEGSLSITRLNVNVSGLADGLNAQVSPETVDIILSGPLPILDTLTADRIMVSVDLTGQGPGTYQLVPRVQMPSTDLKLESVLPGSIEVTITQAPTPTPTPKVSLTPGPTSKVSPIPKVSPTPTESPTQNE
jgi:YbbR domain-containing protein